ncbi:MAG TPA: glycosyltransferase family protein [Oscillatoriaceae cyanobacterium]
MDPRRVTFISCVNDEALYARCLRELQSLEVPPGFEVEQLAVRGAPSMTVGYNAAMRANNAKYKIYLHQDVFITHKGFLHDVIATFERDPGLGMLGLVGAEKLPAHGIWWDSEGPKYGAVFEFKDNALHLRNLTPVVGKPQLVQAIDGLLMATQVDLPWNERIEGFDFYDVSHALDFWRADYQVAVVDQGALPWVIHALGEPLDEESYRRHRLRFLELYR